MWPHLRHISRLTATKRTWLGFARLMELDQTQFAHRLVSGMSDAIIYADAEGVIRLWNRGATRIFGFTEAEAVGRSLA
jgi:PAS domain-containing protein